MESRNRFQGMNSASLCSLAGRYEYPIPTRFLAPIYCLKLQLCSFTQRDYREEWPLLTMLKLRWMGTQRGQMIGVLPWLIRWARRAGTIDFSPALAALISPVQNIIFLTVHFFTLVPIAQQPRQAAVLVRLSLCLWTRQMCVLFGSQIIIIWLWMCIGWWKLAGWEDIRDTTPRLLKNKHNDDLSYSIWLFILLSEKYNCHINLTKFSMLRVCFGSGFGRYGSRIWETFRSGYTL